MNPDRTIKVLDDLAARLSTARCISSIQVQRGLDEIEHTRRSPAFAALPRLDRMRVQAALRRTETALRRHTEDR